MKNTLEEQMKIISKGVDTIVGLEDLEEKLRRSMEEGRPLICKLGLDPTAPDIHLGHTVVLRKLRQMQDLGHRVVIIIGDFTGRIGDPSGKSKGRVSLTEEEVLQNARTYEEQIFRVLDTEKTSVRFNSEWLSKISLEEVLRLASTTTIARLLERNDFEKRYRSGIPIGLHEFFYPLLQAQDSVELDVDIEIGGTDQTFNILMGRTLQKALGKPQQTAVFMPLLEGLDGVEKMSKSLGNYIGVDEEAQVMYKKVMEIPDRLILRYFELVTDEHPDRIAGLGAAMEQGRNPRDVKRELAGIITSLYHGSAETERAVRFYEEAFSNKDIPEDIPGLHLEQEYSSLYDIIPVLTDKQIIKSGSDFRRLLQQGGVQLNKVKVDSLEIRLQDQDVLRIGKKQFIRIIR